MCIIYDSQPSNLTVEERKDVEYWILVRGSHPIEQAQWTLAGVQNVLFGRYTRTYLRILRPQILHCLVCSWFGQEEPVPLAISRLLY
jgi:hypothetical protein